MQKDSYTFSVEGSTTAIQFQFYKNPEKWSASAQKDWEALEKLVTVEFKEKTETK